MKKVFLLAVILFVSAGCAVKTNLNSSAPKSGAMITEYSNYNIFQDDQLGIKFQYQNNPPVMVKVDGNKIILSDPRFSGGGQKILQVFNVDKKQDPQQVIQNQLLQNYPACEAKGNNVTANGGYIIQPKIWETQQQTDPNQAWYAFHAQDCPIGYIYGSGVRFFRFYSDADKVVFYDLGQDVWPFSDNTQSKLFTETIEVY